MSKERFGKVLTSLQAQYLPQGEIELVEEEEIKDHQFLSGLPFLKSISEVQLESEDRYYVISRISEKIFLSISDMKSNSNTGILLSVSKRISNEIRSVAMKPI